MWNYESQLERDFLYLLDHDPNCIDLQAQPCHVPHYNPGINVHDPQYNPQLDPFNPQFDYSLVPADYYSPDKTINTCFG